MHPPVTEECQQCREPIRLGGWTKPTITSRGEPCKVLHCCAGIVCNECFDERREDEEETCPLCDEPIPPVGSEEMKNQIVKNAEGGHAESQVHLICLLGPSPVAVSKIQVLNLIPYLACILWSSVTLILIENISLLYPPLNANIYILQF